MTPDDTALKSRVYAKLGINPNNHDEHAFLPLLEAALLDKNLWINTNLGKWSNGRIARSVYIKNEAGYLLGYYTDNGDAVHVSLPTAIAMAVDSMQPAVE